MGKKTPTVKNSIDWQTIAKQLGNGKPLSKQRVYQLAREGKLQARLDGVNFSELHKNRMRVWRTDYYLDLLSKRGYGESIAHLAKRLKVSYTSLKRHAGSVPFVEERRQAAIDQRHHKKSVKQLAEDRVSQEIVDQRLPGESIAELATRLKMSYKRTLKAFGGRVDFASERRRLEQTDVKSQAKAGYADPNSDRRTTTQRETAEPSDASVRRVVDAESGRLGLGQWPMPPRPDMAVGRGSVCEGLQ